MALNKRWGWPYAAFCAISISLCIVIDILQYSAVLSFLPQGLKDEGYQSHEISAVIGSYYWAGFLGGTCITSWQIRKVIAVEAEPLRWSHLKSHIVNLIIGLMCGAVALTLEGLWPTMGMHVVTRFVQGFLGAFLFFFSFFLSIELFQARSFQQRIAITMSTMALHCAEVLGPFFGASIFMRFGQSAVFFTLAGLSLFGQLMLFIVYVTLPKDTERYDVTPPSGVCSPAPSDRQTATERAPLLPKRDLKKQRVRAARQRWSELKDMLTTPMLWRSVLVVAPAAMVKAALENILPLFADHKLKYNEYEVGLCFTLIAVSFLSTSIIIGFAWGYLDDTGQNWFVTLSMVFLGLTSSILLLAYMYGGDCNLLIDDLFDATPDCAPYKHSVRFFYFCLVLFGIASAGCFTPAGYLIGEYVDSLTNPAVKDAANGIWNTLWEVGGCLGIALSGIPDARNWVQEQVLMTSIGMVIIICAFTFFWVSMLSNDDDTDEEAAVTRCCIGGKELKHGRNGTGDLSPILSSHDSD
jgi:MFS family permease